jgi:hypothetical protein
LWAEAAELNVSPIAAVVAITAPADTSFLMTLLLLTVI